MAEFGHLEMDYDLVCKEYTTSFEVDEATGGYAKMTVNDDT